MAAVATQPNPIQLAGGGIKMAQNAGDSGLGSHSQKLSPESFSLVRTLGTVSSLVFPDPQVEVGVGGMIMVKQALVVVFARQGVPPVR